MVKPPASFHMRVSCLTRPPPARTAPCRRISWRSAASTERSELTFFVSVRVPSSVEPLGMRETLASQRS